jgi:small multidrug resistance family-3 protein
LPRRYAVYREVLRGGEVACHRRVVRGGRALRHRWRLPGVGWMREHKPCAWALLGAAVLAAYGMVAALQPISEFGRVYAAHGGVFIALALLWGAVVDWFGPDRYDLLGVLICVIGAVVMVAPSRG